MIKYIKYGAILVLIILSLLVLFISHFVLSYPVKYYNIIEKYALINNIDTEMVLSVINIESSFDEMSISKAGAIGLMQLKLETANDMAIRNKENIITKYQLYDPELNIKYGCKYLRYLIDYYNGNLILALCADM